MGFPQLKHLRSTESDHGCEKVDIIGVYRYCNLYPRALAMVASGKINLKPLISKTFKLEVSGRGGAESPRGGGDSDSQLHSVDFIAGD